MIKIEIPISGDLYFIVNNIKFNKLIREVRKKAKKTKCSYRIYYKLRGSWTPEIRTDNKELIKFIKEKIKNF